MVIRSKCPNCESDWGIEEMDWNKCFACGYPDNDEDDDDYDDWPEDDDDRDDNDPNDSRNL